MVTKPATVNFEQALSELEDIVRQLESGKISLDDSVTAYERGMALRKICEDTLKDAELKIQKVSVDAAGNTTLTDLDLRTLNEKS